MYVFIGNQNVANDILRDTWPSRSHIQYVGRKIVEKPKMGISKLNS